MKNTQTKSKVLVLIIGILLIANIATLSIMLMNKCDCPKSGKHDRRAVITSFLQKEVGFDQEQLARYDSLSSRHRAEMKQAYDEMAEKRENNLRQLASIDFNDSAMQNTSSVITEKLNAFEMMLLNHIKSIRNICTPGQKAKFDSGFYKVISKRNEARKGK